MLIVLPNLDGGIIYVISFTFLALKMIFIYFFAQFKFEIWPWKSD